MDKTQALKGPCLQLGTSVLLNIFLMYVGIKILDKVFDYLPHIKEYTNVAITEITFNKRVRLFVYMFVYLVCVLALASCILMILNNIYPSTCKHISDSTTVITSSLLLLHSRHFDKVKLILSFL